MTCSGVSSVIHSAGWADFSPSINSVESTVTLLHGNLHISIHIQLYCISTYMTSLWMPNVIQVSTLFCEKLPWRMGSPRTDVRWHHLQPSSSTQTDGIPKMLLSKQDQRRTSGFSMFFQLIFTPNRQAQNALTLTCLSDAKMICSPMV